MFDVVDEAIYRTVHGFPGGAVKLAPRVNMNAGTLSNKANPTMDAHQLTVRESLSIQLSTSDCQIFYAMGVVLSHACIPLGSFNGISDLELLSSYADYHAEVGKTAQSVRDAVADGRITREECARVKRHIHRETQRAFEFLSRLEALVDD